MANATQGKSLIDQLLPAGVNDMTPDQRFRSELVLAFGLFEVFVATLICVSELAWGTQMLGVIYLLGLPPIIGILIWLRQGGNPSSVGTALMIIVFALLTITNLCTGGRAFGANISLPTVALFGILISSRRAGFIWVLLIVVQIIAMAFLRRSNFDFPISPNPEWVSSAIDRVPLLFSLGSALIGWMVLRALLRYQSRLEVAREAELIAKVAAICNAERFSDFAEIAADGFWETDSQLRLIYVSPSFAQVMGLNCAQMLGLTPEQAYRLRFPEAPELSSYSAPMLKRLPYQHQLMSVVDNAGNKRWLLNQGRPFFDDTGEFSGYRGAVRDITEQKHVEKALRSSEQRQQLISDNMPALVAYVDHEQRFQFCNATNGKVFGVEPAAIIGRTMREVRGEVAYAQLVEHVTAALRGERVSFEGRGLGNYPDYYYQSIYIPDIDPSGLVCGFFAMTFDISIQKETQHRLTESEQRLRLITDNLPALISYIDLERRFRFNNKPYETWLARPLDEITGRRVADVYSAETFGLIEPHMELAFSGQTVTFELATLARHVRVSYIPDIDHSGAVRGVYGLINDISLLKQVENELRTLAQYDPLTGLANRHRYNERLAEAIARSERSGQAMVLMFLDLDNFKMINDSLGHKAGDLVLQEFARRIEQNVRRTDTVARLAGDEFVIILEALHASEETKLIAQKILDAMMSDFDIEGDMRHLSTSIGIAMRNTGETDGEAILRRADAALYAAKASGRGVYRIAE